VPPSYSPPLARLHRPPRPPRHPGPARASRRHVLPRAADPGRALLGDAGERASAEACEAFNVRYGLDKPIPVQLVVYVQNILQGDLGFSLQSSRPVTQVMVDRMPLTIELTSTALVIAVAVGIPLGLLSAAGTTRSSTSAR
jgi:ABC-type dipeptide/oligopeptide/nickel transport system permease component